MTSTSILDINSDVNFEEAITRYEYHSYAPFTSVSLDATDTVMISVNQESAYLLLSESGIYVEGTITKENGDALEANTAIKFVDFGICFLLNEVRLDINNVEVDSCRNCGVTAAMKNLVSCSESESKKFATTGWNCDLVNTSDFSFCGYIPLKFILGFAESYDRILLNQRLDLTIIRNKSSKDCLFTNVDTTAKINLKKIFWKIPQVQVNDTIRLDLLTQYKKNTPINLAFRKWSLNYYPNLPESKECQWTLKTSSNFEKPRYIILGFQTNRSNDLKKDPSKFDHCKLTNLKVFLNSEFYPNENLNVDFTKKKYMPLYLMYCAFQESFYGKVSEPFLTYDKFVSDAPLIVIDTSKQVELFKHSSSVDIRVEFELADQAAKGTTLFALIIHDSLIKLLPLTNTIQKVM